MERNDTAQRAIPNLIPILFRAMPGLLRESGLDPKPSRDVQVLPLFDHFAEVVLPVKRESRHHRVGTARPCENLLPQHHFEFNLDHSLGRPYGPRVNSGRIAPDLPWGLFVADLHAFLCRIQF